MAHRSSGPDRSKRRGPRSWAVLLGIFGIVVLVVIAGLIALTAPHGADKAFGVNPASLVTRVRVGQVTGWKGVKLTHDTPADHAHYGGRSAVFTAVDGRRLSIDTWVDPRGAAKGSKYAQILAAYKADKAGRVTYPHVVGAGHAFLFSGAKTSGVLLLEAHGVVVQVNNPTDTAITFVQKLQLAILAVAAINRVYG